MCGSPFFSSVVQAFHKGLARIHSALVFLVLTQFRILFGLLCLRPARRARVVGIRLLCLCPPRWVGIVGIGIVRVLNRQRVPPPAASAFLHILGIWTGGWNRFTSGIQLGVR